MAFTVKAAAELSGVSIRTLHHYDEIGLLRPAQVSESGYRLYAMADLERLQQILFYRELGFSLPEIKSIIERPGFDRTQALREQKRLLLERQERLGRLITTIDRTIDSLERSIPMATSDLKELFDGFDPSQYEEEVQQRWGHTDAYRQSKERTSKYTKQDWAALKAEMGEINLAIAAQVGQDPANPQVQEAVGRWHRLINDRFYTCSTEVFRGLGQMYVADERFTATYEAIRPGMAQFLHDAMMIYCDRLEGR